jgi:MerR family transcriptional regulator, copper efflux regulator
MTERLLQIGEVAARVQLSLRTIRHYDACGLVTPSGRSEGGFRLYSEEDVERLRIVKGMKPSGLALDEMRELLDLLEDRAPDGNAGSRTERLEYFLAATAAEAERLERHVGEVRLLSARVQAALQGVSSPRRESVHA